MEGTVKDSVNGVKNLFKSSHRKESNQLFHELDVDKSNTADIAEISRFATRVAISDAPRRHSSVIGRSRLSALPGR